MMLNTNIIAPVQIPENFFDPNLNEIIRKGKRDLNEENKGLYKLCKKFAAMCEEDFGKTKCVNIEEISDKNYESKSDSNEGCMNDIK